MTIRRATVGDADKIADCLMLAMDTIVYGFIGEENHDKAWMLLNHFAKLTDNQYSYQNCWVAMEQQQICGVINVYDGADLYRLRLPVLAYLREVHGRHVHPEDETTAGEFYIDTIGVYPHCQGRGIGTRLLRFAIDEFVRRRRQTLGLLVEKQNPKARKLYQKLGFEYISDKTLMGKQMEHWQIWPGKEL